MTVDDGGKNSCEVGITPHLSILHHDNDTCLTALIYGSRVVAQIVYRDDLEMLDREHETKIVCAFT